jgi:hypothetical protein
VTYRWKFPWLMSIRHQVSLFFMSLFIIYSLFFILYSLLFILYSLFFILYSLFVILYSLFFILYSLFFILYSLFFILYSLFSILLIDVFCRQLVFGMPLKRILQYYAIIFISLPFIYIFLRRVRFGLHTKWIGFTDVDEFLFIPKVPGQPVPSLTKFLANFSDVGGVMVDRINFGPNGHKTRPPGLVIESYTKR